MLLLRSRVRRWVHRNNWTAVAIGPSAKMSRFLPLRGSVAGLSRNQPLQGEMADSH
jgi:hypothetical protein